MALVLTLLVGGAAAARVRPAPAASGNPLAGLGPGSYERLELTGRVAERLAAGSYTYVRVVDGAGAARWVVTLGRLPPGADRVRVVTMAHVRDFASARLGRRFDDLFFGTVRALPANP
ncbi:MAG: hypothetical protein EOO75_14330 [Myxococcales bacterium]|nr:MAG: hypothetical protein EOO75_14330 [Myxococcales bacterium]